MTLSMHHVPLPTPSERVLSRLRTSGPGTPPLRERVRDVLRDWIVYGELAAGLRLFELDLAGVLGVSRLPVREAIRMLEADGFVTVESRKVRVRTLDPATVTKLFDVAECLEVLAARLAAENITPAGVRVLAHILEDGRAALDSGDFAVIDRVNPALHDEISHLAGNEILDGILGPVRGRIQCLLWNSSESGRIWREHAALFDAIAAGDPARAEETARTHIHSSRQEVLAALAGASR
jgi:DNA-binding GntR family transcriptional regulator